MDVLVGICILIIKKRLKLFFNIFKIYNVGRKTSISSVMKFMCVQQIFKKNRNIIL